MGNSHLVFPNEGLKLKNPASPKLVSGNMIQSKATASSPKSTNTGGSPKSTNTGGSPKSTNTTGGSPKSPKSPDGNSKSSSASSSKSSPSSTKSSPGNNKSISLVEKLALSTRGKSNPSLKSPVSKSSPTSPISLTVSKAEMSKESTDPCLNKVEQDKDNVSVEFKLENVLMNNEISDEKESAVIENENNESNEIQQEDVDVNAESNQTEMKENDDLIEVIGVEATKCDLNEVMIIDTENSCKPKRIDDSVILELTSKKDVRQKVWEFLEENSLVVFPKPCFNRIPNFNGCSTATLSLEKLEEFKKAKTVQVTPDKAQETARFLTLSWGKRLLVPLLRLKEGLLQNVSLPFAEPSAKMLRSASTQKGLRKWGNKLITLDQNNDGHHIDMIIMGSVAVDKKGHRIGIGNGFCDLEFVILSSMNMVTDNTVVVTIVHDIQVFDTLPTELFKPYDVPVDIIITPTEVIRVANRLDRPKDVFWNYISKRRLLEMPPLQLLRTKQEQDSDFNCTLKEVDSEPEEIPPSPITFKKTKGYYHRRSYSTRSETNDSVFKDAEVSKRRSTSKQSSSAPMSRNSNSKGKHNRAKSTSSQHRSTSTSKNNQNDQKQRHSSKKPNKRRTKSESAKTIVPPVTVSEQKNSNGVQANSPSNDTPKNKRRSRQKPCNNSDEINQSVSQFNTNPKDNKKRNSRSNSRATRRDYIDYQDVDRDISVGRKAHREYIQSPKKYYSQNRHRSSYSQERPLHSDTRSNSRVQRRDRSVVMPQNRHPNGPVVRQTRYFNGPMVRHNSYNGPVPRQNGINNHIRHNSYSNESLGCQESFYDGVISRRNNFSTNRYDSYTNSRVFRPPQYHNGIASQTNERDYVRESRPRFNNNRHITNGNGYFNSHEKPKYSRSTSGDEFVLKVGNIANNVRVRDLKAALMERGVKPLHITWRGPRGFAYLRYSISMDVNKDNVMGSLQNVRIKPNGVETAQTQTLIVTECQFS